MVLKTPTTSDQGGNKQTLEATEIRNDVVTRRLWQVSNSTEFVCCVNNCGFKAYKQCAVRGKESREGHLTLGGKRWHKLRPVHVPLAASPEINIDWTVGLVLLLRIKGAPMFPNKHVSPCRFWTHWPRSHLFSFDYSALCWRQLWQSQMKMFVLPIKRGLGSFFPLD